MRTARTIWTTILIFLATLCSAQDSLLFSHGISVVSCSAVLFDSGGPNGNYANNELSSMTFCAEDPEGCIQMDFVFFDIENGWDDLFIYGGPDDSFPLIAELTGDISPGVISTSSECVTLNFISDGSVTNPGFEIIFSCACPTCDDGIMNGEELGVDCGGPDCPPCDFQVISQEDTITTCDLVLMDAGGLSNYSAGEDYAMTICADDADDCLEINFAQFELAFGDVLALHDGLDINGPLIASYTNTDAPVLFTTSSDCVTFHFTSSTTSVTAAGFNMLINCTDVCPTCDDGVLNGFEIGVDCGGPDCPDCPFFFISDEGTVTSCDAVILDSGGLSEDYGNNEDYTMVVCADVPNSCVQLDFISFDIEQSFDDLFIFAGPDNTAPLIASLTGDQDPGLITPGSECVTLNFTTDGSVTNPGFEIAVTCVCPTCDDGIQNGLEIGIDCGGPDCPSCGFNFISEEGTLTTCGGILYDSGGVGGAYSNLEDYTMTICADDANSCVQLDFLSFNIEQGFDNLFVYAGSDVNAPLVASLTGSIDPGLIAAGTECITLNFTSDGSITSTGFEIAITCQCPSCDDGILNGQEIDVDCGGPDCEPCDFNIISEEDSLITCEGTLMDSGAFENYSAGEDYTMTYCADNADDCLQVDFVSLGLAFGDLLEIYDGADLTGFQLDALTSTDVVPSSMVAPSGCVTFHFTSAPFSPTAEGFELNLTCTSACPTCDDGILNGYELDVDCGGPDCDECDYALISEEGTYTSCNGLIFDSGFTEAYANNEDYTMVVCAEDASECIQLDIIEFNTENGLDVLSIYSGTDDSGVQLAALSGTNVPPVISGTGPCVTLVFQSDLSVTSQGFQIHVSCAECPVVTEQDCLGAIEICDLYYEQANAYSGSGTFPNEVDGAITCLDGELNSVWYTFTVQESGTLNFVIDPIDDNDDYDWALFNITDASCEEIFSDGSLLVSCNSYGVVGANGPTGISSDMGGVGSNNGPGNLNGPIFNEDITVVEGQVYALLVEDWSGTPTGYSIDFGDSDAGLFYPGGPDMTEFTPTCSALEVGFSEPIDCSTLQAEDFMVSLDDMNSTVLIIDSIAADCSFNNQAESVVIYLSGPFPDNPTDYLVNYSEAGGLILDLCGVPVPLDTTYTFSTPQWIFVTPLVTPTECFDEVGVINFGNTAGGIAPLTYSFEGEEVTTTQIDGLGVGTYTIEVTDAQGCHIAQEVEVETDIEEIIVTMPNVFTPNDDGANELFGPQATRVHDGTDLGLVDIDKHFSYYRLEIYNRWGRQVFIGDFGRPFWNGQDEDVVAEGTYFYVIRYTKACSLLESEVVEEKGTLTLMR